MDFKDTIKQLAERIEKMKDNVQTEEATKAAFIMPFISVLGYDVFNPLEVIPEYTCDIGTKKGEKIDYAIVNGGDPAILIECKHCDSDLNIHHNNQLLRYFNTSKARFGVLTNGIVYRFYTDLEKENVMDTKPFLEINLIDTNESQIEELRKFHKSYFDVGNIMNTASELKYTNELKQLLSLEFSSPSPEFVKLFAKQIYTGQMTPRIMEQFTPLVKRAAIHWKNDIINERFKAALTTNSDPIPDKTELLTSEEKPGVLTTEEELQGFYIVKSILAQKLPLHRVYSRDTLSYFGVLLDDNNRKPICRLHFDSAKKYIETFDQEKKGTKHHIETLEDIYNHAEEISAIVEVYIMAESN